MSGFINFRLKEPNKNNVCLIVARVYITRQQRFEISTGQKIIPAFWNAKNRTVKKSQRDIKKFLKDFKDELEHKISFAESQKISITKEYLTGIDKTAKTQENFFIIFNEFISSQKTKCSKPNVQKFELLKNYLLQFSDKHKYEINFDTININFFELFNKFMLYEIGFFNATASKTITYFKTFMNYAFDKGYHANLLYKKWKELKDNSEEIIALTNNELKQIEELSDLQPYLQRAKDLFLILCYTGIRFSDLRMINENKIIDDTITIIVQKTKELHKIFVHDVLKNVLTKYTNENGVIKLPLISNAKLNEYLKEIGQKAELNDNCFKVRYKGGEAKEFHLKKWQLLTTHTGRRTFTTLSLNLGINSEIVKKMTGHKTDKSFKKYVRFNEQQLKQAANEGWNKR